MLKKKVKRDRFRSKYMDLDYNSMLEEEFSKVSKKVYLSIFFRSIGGVILFILCILALVLIDW